MLPFPTKMSLIIAIAVFVYVLDSVCGKKPAGPQPRVFSGEPVGDREHVFVVSVQKATNVSVGENTHICAGALVGKRHVLTVANCVADKTQSYTVLYGTKKLIGETGDNGRGRVGVTQVAIHPRWSTKSHASDIAVLTLSKDVPVGVYTNTIRLQDKNKPVGKGYQCQVLGWGVDEDDGFGLHSNILIGTFLNDSKIVNLSDCRHLNQNLQLANTIVCPQVSTQGFCHGDIGSPLVCRDPADKVKKDLFLMGLAVETMYPCGIRSKPGMFTRLPHPRARNFIVRRATSIHDPYDIDNLP